MCLSLIVAGKVQIDIRLFISLKSQEGFKWDIKAVFRQRLAADRTVLIRHITTGTSRIG